MIIIKIIKGLLSLLKQNYKDKKLQMRTKYAFYYKYVKIDAKTVLYESFFGRGMICNPYAIFLELMEDPKYKKFKHVWVLDKLDDHKDLIMAYKKYSNIIFVQYQSKQYLKYLCKAKYLVNNVTFPAYFTKKEGQIYVNTWHGIPLKHLGYDMPNGNVEVSNTVRNFLHTDYLISASPFLTEVYKYAYKMDNIYNGKIIEEGYPRLDILFRFSREDILKKLLDMGMQIDETKKIVLYAPTWRGVSYGKADKDVECYYKFKQELERCIDTNKYQLLIKVHQRVYELSKDSLDKAFFVPATIDANEILAITDILISDFSSIFYDYLATGRPVLFYIQNVDEYLEERGLYGGLDSLPGPITEKIDELGKLIGNIDKVAEEYHAKYMETRTYSNAFSDGKISKKIVDIVFNHNENAYKLTTVKHNKEKIFVSRGVMLVNGITSACLNLLNEIDYDRFDVTLMVAKMTQGKESDMLNQINPNVRVLYRNSTFNASFSEQIKEKYRKYIKRKSIFSEEMYRECKRCYGNTTFDYVFDYEGYNNFYATLLLHMNGEVKGIWQHNDLFAEKELKFPWLDEFFKLYKYFDRVISCSQAIMEVNREKLGGIYCDKEKFTYAKNIIDSKRVLEGAAQGKKIIYRNQEYCLTEFEEDDNYVMSRLIPLSPWFVDSDMLSLDGEKYFSQEVSCQGNGIIKMGFCPENTVNAKIRRFVTVGRMSPEKNHEALIMAFKKLLHDEPGCMLYIIGDGPLRKKTQTLIDSLHIRRNVILTGNLDNPFVLLKYCDCFILPSLHEGQPMVIHEARVLHMPIIMSEFSSAKGSMVESGQLLIGTGENDIYEGLKAYIDGKVPNSYLFDVSVYNDEAYHEFLNAIQAR